MSAVFGGDGGNRSRVQNSFTKGSTGVVSHLSFPSPNGGRQPYGYGSSYYLTGNGTPPRSCSPLNRRSQKVRGTTLRERRRP